MARGIDVSLVGDKEIERALAKMMKDMGIKIMAPAISAGATIVRREAKKECPVRTGLLRKAIGKKLVRYRNQGVVWAAVGVRTGFRQQVGVWLWGKKKGQPKYQDPDKYAHLVHRGTRHSKANPFILRAYAQSQAAAWAKIQQVAQQKVQQYL